MTTKTNKKQFMQCKESIEHTNTLHYQYSTYSTNKQLKEKYFLIVYLLPVISILCHSFTISVGWDEWLIFFLLLAAQHFFYIMLANYFIHEYYIQPWQQKIQCQDAKLTWSKIMYQIQIYSFYDSNIYILYYIFCLYCIVKRVLDGYIKKTVSLSLTLSFMYNFTIFRQMSDVIINLIQCCLAIKGLQVMLCFINRQ